MSHTHVCGISGTFPSWHAGLYVALCERVQGVAALERPVELVELSALVEPGFLNL